MCDIWKTTATEEIGVQDLARMLGSIDQLKVKWVVLTGGEPLMHSDLWPLCAMLKERGIRITLLSSGLLLARYAKQIAEFIDDVIVSLDGPREVHDSIRGIAGAFDLSAQGVEALRGIPISARSTVQRQNFNRLCDTAEAAQSMGLNSISFLAADLTSIAFARPTGWPENKQRSVALDSEDLARLDEELEALARFGSFVLESQEKLRRIALHFRAHLGLAEPVAPHCRAPWKSAVIEADGSVRPCFFHRSIGNVRSILSLEQIVNGPEAEMFRDSLDIGSNPICRRCVCSLS
jgi:MoaA/NifB/PqqE/SkfB family radical SAM enzyme